MTPQEQTQAVHHFWLYPLQHLPFPHADNIRHTPQITQHLSSSELHVLPNLVVKILHPNPPGLESSEKAPELASVASTNLPRVPVVRLQLRCQDALVAILVATMTGHSWWISTLLQPEMRLPSIHVVSIGWPAPCLAAQANDLSVALEPRRLANLPILLASGGPKSKPRLAHGATNQCINHHDFVFRKGKVRFIPDSLVGKFGLELRSLFRRKSTSYNCPAMQWYLTPLMAYIAPARWFTSITLLSCFSVLGCLG